MINDKIDEILLQHREYIRGVRTDRLIGASDETTKQAILALMQEEYKRGYIAGGIEQLTN